MNFVIFLVMFYNLFIEDYYYFQKINNFYQLITQILLGFLITKIIFYIILIIKT